MNHSKLPRRFTRHKEKGWPKFEPFRAFQLFLAFSCFVCLIVIPFTNPRECTADAHCDNGDGGTCNTNNYRCECTGARWYWRCDPMASEWAGSSPAAFVFWALFITFVATLCCTQDPEHAELKAIAQLQEEIRLLKKKVNGENGDDANGEF